MNDNLDVDFFHYHEKLYFGVFEYFDMNLEDVRRNL